MADDINDDDIELLGELGVETAPVATGGRTAKEQRLREKKAAPAATPAQPAK